MSEVRESAKAGEQRPRRTPPAVGNTRPRASAPIPADAVLVGVGGTGVTYRIATPDGLRALKAVDATGVIPRIELRRELERLSRATHPGLAIVRRVEERDGRLHVVRDWAQGPSLEAVLAERRVLPFAEAAPTLRAVAESVGALHHEGFVHREVKPGHVLGVGPGAKLIDAGLPSLDPDYTPPEWNRYRIATSRSDLWQLGALTIHMLGGAPPRRGGKLPTSAPRALREIVDALLVENARDRPFGVRPFLDVLRLLGGFDDVEEISGLVELDAKAVPRRVTMPPPLPSRRAKAPEPTHALDDWTEPNIPVGFGTVVAAWTDGARRAWHWADVTAKRVVDLARSISRRTVDVQDADPDRR